LRSLLGVVVLLDNDRWRLAPMLDQLLETGALAILCRASWPTVTRGAGQPTKMGPNRASSAAI